MKFHETNEGKKRARRNEHYQCTEKEAEKNISDFYAFLLRLSLSLK
jgi:hypothetical protein